MLLGYYANRLAYQNGMDVYVVNMLFILTFLVNWTHYPRCIVLLVTSFHYPVIPNFFSSVHVYLHLMCLAFLLCSTSVSAGVTWLLGAKTQRPCCLIFLNFNRSESETHRKRMMWLRDSEVSGERWMKSWKLTLLSHTAAEQHRGASRSSQDQQPSLFVSLQPWKGLSPVAEIAA